MPSHSKSHPAQPSTSSSSPSNSPSISQLSRELSTQLDLHHRPSSSAAVPLPHARRAAPRLYLLLSLLQYRAVQERLRVAVVDVDGSPGTTTPPSVTATTAGVTEATAKLYERHRLGTRLRFRCTREAQRR